MQLPDILLQYAHQAEQIVLQGGIKTIEFASGTYQVQVKSSAQEAPCWAFLQLDELGLLRDCFCSCDQTDDASSCPHLTAAFLAVHDSKGIALHSRFVLSLWNKLCHLYSDKLGADPAILTPSESGRFSCSSFGKKTVFLIHARSSEAKQRLNKLLYERDLETEETSLKFSNLSQEELALWREGNPSPQLSYELSFWSDVAKWLMALQSAQAPYTIQFSHSSKAIPNQIRIVFEEIELAFYLSETNLIEIIPALQTVISPLCVFSTSHEAIEKITYDPATATMHLVRDNSTVLGMLKEERQIEREGIALDGWLYVKDVGFYERDPHHIFSYATIEGEQINTLLKEHYSVVKELLVGVKLHRLPVAANYHIFFDEKWSLHITCYLFTPMDLTQGNSRLFGEWVYLEEDGFYRLEEGRFASPHMIIPKEHVAGFVRDQRIWLNDQLGFRTHIASIEAQLTYELSEDNRLSFFKKVSREEQGVRSCDFGSWMYIEGQGFYAKSSAPLGLSFHEGLTLNADQIPIFIRMNRDELLLVPHFFSERCPVERAGLTVMLAEDDHTVIVTPHYIFYPEYVEKLVRFFDDIAYVEGEGFHELPAPVRLPERFRQRLLLDQEGLALFLNYELHAIQHHLVKIDPRLIKPHNMQLVAGKITRQESHGRQWYGLKLAYHSEQGSVPLTKLWAAIKERRRYLFSAAGLIDLEERRYNWVRMLAKERIDRRANTVALSTLELIRLNALDTITLQEGCDHDDNTTAALLAELTEFRTPQPPNIAGLQSSLRPYQQLGLEWLWFLYKHQLSGLLCDDMGLGKTHQTMALMAAIANEHKSEEKDPCHFLIICPTSVFYHWQEKLAQFLPHLHVCTFYGTNRSYTSLEKPYDILLTSYGVWRMESKLLKETFFEVAIFDEIQIAKNYASRIHAALTAVKAKMRLGLTGTPIENHLRELKALFDITLPTYMLGEAEYRDFFIKPIEREGNEERMELLSRLIRPFVLRRKKAEVLLDLPEKIEEIIHCDLSQDQKALYNEVLARSRPRLLRELTNTKSPIPYMHIFALLSSLKQICNHPACYLKKPDKYKNFSSGKWDLFVEILSEARESGQKVVVFSQYLHMLDIIERFLQEERIGFAGIRGATRDRAQQLQRFANDARCEVFVASLQAAGLGIDLTAASVVFHYDRWWNAAREDQATDRVHRLGQTRGVQVLKPVTKNTFEEHIDALINRKAGLMEIVGSDDHHLIKQFDRAEIMELLQLLDDQVEGERGSF